MLSTTLATILGDKGFQVPSPRAQEALVVTKKLFAWCQDENNKQQYLSFELWLVSTLKKKEEMIQLCVELSCMLTTILTLCFAYWRWKSGSI